jgi:hypothetical protein
VYDKAEGRGGLHLHAEFDGRAQAEKESGVNEVNDKAVSFGLHLTL